MTLRATLRTLIVMDNPSPSQASSLLNTLIEPDFPVDQEQARTMTPETFFEHLSSSPETFQTWFQYINSMEAYKVDMQRVCTQLETRIEGLKTENAIAIAAAAAKAETFEYLYRSALNKPLQASHTPKTTKIPDPDRFSGDRNKLEEFLAQLQLKLQANADHFPTVNTKLSYAIGLDGIALKQVMPQLKEDSVEFADHVSCSLD